METCSSGVAREGHHHGCNLTNYIEDMLDVAAAYPNNGQSLNISKETTSREIIKIEGVEETNMRMATINMSGGRTNALEIANSLFGLPTLDVWLEAFEADVT